MFSNINSYTQKVFKKLEKEAKKAYKPQKVFQILVNNLIIGN